MIRRKQCRTHRPSLVMIALCEPDLLPGRSGANHCIGHRRFVATAGKLPGQALPQAAPAARPRRERVGTPARWHIATSTTHTGNSGHAEPSPHRVDSVHSSGTCTAMSANNRKWAGNPLVRCTRCACLEEFLCRSELLRVVSEGTPGIGTHAGCRERT